MATYDVAVVGGGSAGCVIAARLSEDAGRRVLLLEAGPDYASIQALPADLADGRRPAFSHDWGYASEPDPVDRSIQLPRGRVMGGCSSTNATIALRGSPADYDAWLAMGNPGWSFEELLPFFRAAETDGDFDESWHGRSGPLPIRRYPADEMSPWSGAFLEAAVTRGHAAVADHNRPWAVGAGPAPTNAKDGVRMSTALAYLADVRSRPNLEIQSGVLVDRIQVEHGTVAGVRLGDGALVEAGTVVLCAGAYGSPSILLRSGIGPPDELRSHGIPVATPLPGVGRNLMDHPITSVDCRVQGPAWDGALFQTILTLHSDGRDVKQAPDLQVFATGPWESGRDRVFALVLSLLKPLSRGSLRLSSTDPTAPPVIDIGHLRHPSDRARMAGLVRAARELWRQPSLARWSGDDELKPGDQVSDLEAWAVANAESCHHPSGTCAMGPDPDAGSVVDASCSVYGIRGLLVADASVMPDIPSANTNIPTIAVAERVAELLRQPAGTAS